MHQKTRTAVGVAAAVCLAFALRVVPAWDEVFTARGVSFQEPDAWYHMRTVHNLLAHFPWRSGFDPYALYPLGKYKIGNVAAAPLWDYMIASTAWLSGAGRPSEKLVDETGAWLPAIVGGLFPIPVFFFARRLFGELSGWLSAFWAAIVPGTFLWVSHLGMADHHAIESMTSFLVLCLMAMPAGWSTAAAGVVLGAYLNVRAAGIFVPAALASTALVEPTLAPVAAATMGVAMAVSIGGSTSVWSSYTTMTLLACIAVAAASALLHRMAVKRNWTGAFLYGCMGSATALAILCVAFFDPARARALTTEIVRFVPWHTGTTLVDEINELVPLWRWPPGGWGAFFSMFGTAWIPALGGFAIVARLAWRRGAPAATLFLIWSITMIAGVLFQARMGAYAGVVVAILAGTASAWVVERIPARLPLLRGVTAAMLVATALATSAPFGIRLADGGPNEDWWSAMDWLRAHTPEPMGDPGAWYRFWPSLAPGKTFAYPASAYSIITPWDKGSWITAIAHRIPDANGAADSAVETARFLTETQPDRALRDMESVGARYAVFGPEVVTVALPALVVEGARRLENYSRVLHSVRDDGTDLRLRVYLPDFYRSMGARLYLFDGQAERSEGAEVFVTETTRTAKGAEREQFLSVRNFAAEGAARAWISAHPSLHATLASADPTRSCVDTEELPWAKRVFASRAERIAGDRQPRVVKIFILGS